MQYELEATALHSTLCHLSALDVTAVLLSRQEPVLRGLVQPLLPRRAGKSSAGTVGPAGRGRTKRNKTCPIATPPLS